MPREVQARWKNEDVESLPANSRTRSLNGASTSSENRRFPSRPVPKLGPFEIDWSRRVQKHKRTQDLHQPERFV